MIGKSVLLPRSKWKYYTYGNGSSTRSTQLCNIDKFDISSNCLERYPNALVDDDIETIEQTNDNIRDFFSSDFLLSQFISDITVDDGDYVYVEDDLIYGYKAEDYGAAYSIEKKNNGYIINILKGQSSQYINVVGAEFPNDDVKVFEITVDKKLDDLVVKTKTKYIFVSGKLTYQRELTFKTIISFGNDESYALERERFVIHDVAYDHLSVIGDSKPFIDTSEKFYRYNNFKILNLNDEEDILFDNFALEDKTEISEEEFKSLFNSNDNVVAYVLNLNK